jgi:hypothetical protein
MALAVSEAVAELASNTDGPTFTTGSFTPTANSLLVAFSWATGTVVNNGISGGGLTWTQRIANIGGAVGTIYSAPVGGSPASMTVSFDCTGDNSTGGHIFVFQVTGHNGAAPVPQAAVTAAGLAAATPTVTFGSNLNTNNAYLVALFNSSNTAATNDPSGFTSIAPVGGTGFNSPATGAEVAYRIGGESGTTLTWGASPSAWRAFGIEIAVDPSGDGVASGTGTATATSAAIKASVGAASAIGPVSGIGDSAAAGSVGTASAIGAASGIGAAEFRGIGAASATGTAIGISDVIAAAALARFAGLRRNVGRMMR